MENRQRVVGPARDDVRVLVTSAAAVALARRIAPATGSEIRRRAETAVTHRESTRLETAERSLPVQVRNAARRLFRNIAFL